MCSCAGKIGVGLDGGVARDERWKSKRESRQGGSASAWCGKQSTVSTVSTVHGKDGVSLGPYLREKHVYCRCRVVLTPIIIHILYEQT